MKKQDMINLLTESAQSLPEESKVHGNKQEPETIEVRGPVVEWVTSQHITADRLKGLVDIQDETMRAQVLGVTALYETKTAKSWAAAGQAVGVTEDIKPKSGASAARLRYIKQEKNADELDERDATRLGRDRRDAFVNGDSEDSTEE